MVAEFVILHEKKNNKKNNDFPMRNVVKVVPITFSS